MTTLNLKEHLGLDGDPTAHLEDCEEEVGGVGVCGKRGLAPRQTFVPLPRTTVREVPIP